MNKSAILLFILLLIPLRANAYFIGGAVIFFFETILVVATLIIFIYKSIRSKRADKVKENSLKEPLDSDK
jgi:hypothetical protein